MRTVFCNLLSAALLIHAMFGCCWHDAHEAVAGEASHGLLEAADCCHEHDGVAERHGPDAPCKGHPHCHGLCNYLPAQKSQVDKCLDHAAVDFAIDANAAFSLQITALLFTPGANATGPTQPVRLHLLHQILLI